MPHGGMRSVRTANVTLVREALADNREAVPGPLSLSMRDCPDVCVRTLLYDQRRWQRDGSRSQPSVWFYAPLIGSRCDRQRRLMRHEVTIHSPRRTKEISEPAPQVPLATGASVVTCVGHGSHDRGRSVGVGLNVGVSPRMHMTVCICSRRANRSMWSSPLPLSRAASLGSIFARAAQRLPPGIGTLIHRATPCTSRGPGSLRAL